MSFYSLWESNVCMKKPQCSGSCSADVIRRTGYCCGMKSSKTNLLTLLNNCQSVKSVELLSFRQSFNCSIRILFQYVAYHSKVAIDPWLLWKFLWHFFMHLIKPDSSPFTLNTFRKFNCVKSKWMSRPRHYFWWLPCYQI